MAEKSPRQPYDNLGRFVPLGCPNQDCDGELAFEGGRLWRCDGLVMPKSTDDEYDACEFTHFDGEPYLAEAA